MSGSPCSPRCFGVLEMRPPQLHLRAYVPSLRDGPLDGRSLCQIWSTLATRDTSVGSCALRGGPRRRGGGGTWRGSVWGLSLLPNGSGGTFWGACPAGCSAKSVFAQQNAFLEDSRWIESLFALLAEDRSFHCSVEQEFGKMMARF